MSSPRSELDEQAIERYRSRFGREPAYLARAPGRVELLGNHTDYNDGYVISAAIDRQVVAAVGGAPIPGGARPRLRLASALDEGSSSELPLEALERRSHWSDYPAGVVRVLATHRDPGQRPDEDLLLAFESDLPVGAGVSSSAALELATAMAWYAWRELAPPPPLEVARLAQRAEVEFVGVPCGLLDQFSSACGRRGHALFLDCRSLDYEHLPLDGVELVVADTGVKHALVDGEYRRLRESCERAVARLASRRAATPDASLRLRDFDRGELEALGESGTGDADPGHPGLDALDRRRALHVIEENRRVLEGRACLLAGDARGFGELMVRSHRSSRDLLGNSCAELDGLIETAERFAREERETWLGGKLSGGGFGGATVHLLSRGQGTAAFTAMLTRDYAKRFGQEPRCFAVGTGEGARVERL